MFVHIGKTIKVSKGQEKKRRMQDKYIGKPKLGLVMTFIAK
jgi:hypothetical protein